MKPRTLIQSARPWVWCYIEVKVRYRALARIYHPDKHDPTRTGMPQSAAADFFKLINYARPTSATSYDIPDSKPKKEKLKTPMQKPHSSKLCLDADRGAKGARKAD